jgi:hypothetical protein
MTNLEKETENKNLKTEINIPKSEMALLQQIAKSEGKDTNQVLSEIITERINQENGIITQSKAKTIEYEQVSIKIPKAVMDLLRFAQPFGGTVEEELEYAIIENVRSRLDSGEFLTGKELADIFKLNPIFNSVLGDPFTN